MLLMMAAPIGFEFRLRLCDRCRLRPTRRNQVVRSPSILRADRLGEGEGAGAGEGVDGDVGEGVGVGEGEGGGG